MRGIGRRHLLLAEALSRCLNDWGKLGEDSYVIL